MKPIIPVILPKILPTTHPAYIDRSEFAQEVKEAIAIGYEDPDQATALDAAQHALCDCATEHQTLLIAQCTCECHRETPSFGQRVPKQDARLGWPGRPWLTKYVCGECYIGAHRACDGRRANGESCECGRCANG